VIPIGDQAEAPGAKENGLEDPERCFLWLGGRKFEVGAGRRKGEVVGSRSWSMGTDEEQGGFGGRRVGWMVLVMVMRSSHLW